MLSSLCSILAVMVLAGGVAMLNNYKKLHEMEQVVASVDPGAVIREARGGVYPSEGKTESRESTMEVLPETMVPGSGMSGAAAGISENDSGSENAADSAAASGKSDAAQPEDGDISPSGQPQQFSEAAQESALETAASSETTAASAKPANSTPSYKVYVVGEGETLYGICFKEYNNIRKLEEICRINSLADENSIYAGQKLLLP